MNDFVHDKSFSSLSVEMQGFSEMATGFLSFLSCRNDAIIILSLHGVNEFLHIYAFYVDLFAFYLHMSCVY